MKYIRSVCILALCFFIFENSGLQAKETQTEKTLDIIEVTSEKGIKAWLVQDTSIPVIAFQFSFVGAGAVNDPPEKQGQARILSNMLDEGAGEYTSQDFQKILNDKAITLSFASNRDHFTGSVKTLTKNKDLTFELLKLALTQPRFDTEPLNRMRAANQSRIRSSLSDPEWIAARILNDTIYGDHPYAQNSGGTLSTLEAITPDDLRTHLKAYLTQDRLRVAVSGDISPQELSTILDHVFSELPKSGEKTKAENFTKNSSGQIYTYQKDIPQSVIQIVQPGIAREHPDYHYARIMNHILGGGGFGSRLMEKIREERGLTYGIYSYFQNLEYTDLLFVGTSTGNENVQEMLSLIKAEFETLKTDGVSQEELENTKSYLIGSLPLSLTSTDRIASLMLSLLRDDLPIDYLDQRKQIIKNASLEDINRVAQTILKPEALTTVIVGQPEEITADKQIETLPNVE